jgi:hypothetical protein
MLKHDFPRSADYMTTSPGPVLDTIRVASHR